MTYTKYAAIAAALLAFATPAVANPTTDALTRQWNYTAANDPNARPQYPVTDVTIICAAGQTATWGTMGAYCEGLPAGRFVTVDQVPAGYNGRVFKIGTRDGRGQQELGW